MVAAEGTEEEEGAEMALNAIMGAIIGAAIEVHKALGPGLLESAYQECLERELIGRGHRVERQRSFPVVYKGATIKRRFRLDMVVDGKVSSRSRQSSTCYPCTKPKSSPTSASGVCRSGSSSTSTDPPF